MNSRPVCFIAMAFGKSDTDAFYEKLILPILRENRITPVIINQSLSNQDINIQIIEQLQNCDFSIVDLTYARPSVYYEAGFAERSVPVIYTVRKDHLSKDQPDELRVHFDLQMKPLIHWDNPKDTAFSQKLDKRLKATILKQWTIQKNSESRNKKEIEEFQSLSQADRLSLMRRRSMARLKKLGYKKWFAPQTNWMVKYHYDDIWQGKINGVFSTNIDSQTYRYVSVHSYPSATKTILEKLKFNKSVSTITSDIDRNIRERINKVYINHIILSIRPVPASRIEDVFQAHRPVHMPNIYELSTKQNIGYSSNSKSVDCFSKWHFISGFKSEKQLLAILNEHIYHHITRESG